jgi:hypothetical protein
MRLAISQALVESGTLMEEILVEIEGAAKGWYLRGVGRKN